MPRLLTKEIDMTIEQAARGLLEAMESMYQNDFGGYQCNRDEATDISYAMAKLETALAQPEQAPVACIYKGYLYMAHEFQPGQLPVGSQPLYTAPPQSRQAGLTGEEMIKAYNDLAKGRFSGGLNPVRAVQDQEPGLGEDHA